MNSFNPTSRRNGMRQLIIATTALTAMFGVAKADIINTVGLTQIVPPTPINISADWLPLNGLPPQVIFAEQQGVTLASPLSTDLGGVIPAGTVVNSYFLAMGSLSFANVSADTAVTFDGRVLGVIYNQDASFLLSPNFALSDFLGLAGVGYNETHCGSYLDNGGGCGFETNPGTSQGFSFDTVSFLGNTAFFHNEYSTPGDIARIITEAAAVPGPIVGAGLPGIIAACVWFFAWRRRRIASLT